MFMPYLTLTLHDYHEITIIIVYMSKFIISVFLVNVYVGRLIFNKNNKVNTLHNPKKNMQ